MHYRNVGKSGLKVSEIALGSWMTRLDAVHRETAENVVREALFQGINFIDCADAYSGGEAERFLGDILKDIPRSDLVLSSKVYFPTGSGINDRGLSRKHIMENIDHTLKNMRTDYIDLYFCHRFDKNTPMEEMLRALSDLVTQGKILYYGVSEEWSAARIERAEAIIEKYQLHPLTVLQPQYNLFDRYIEHEIMDVCSKYGIGITPFSPLSQGLLTGKYKKGEPYPKGSRATYQEDKQINNLLTDENLDKVEELSRIANELGLSMPVLALSWLLQNKLVCSVITGASNPEQLKSNISAIGVVLPKDVLERIDAVMEFVRFERHVG